MIEIENCNSDYYQIVLDATCFFSTQLLPEKSLNRSTIKVLFEDELMKREGYLGQCLKNGRYDYDISIEPTMNLQSIIMTIAHEMVHVNQYVRGYLKETFEEYSIWKGKKYFNNQYYMLPWEIEANGISIALYEHFVDMFSHRDKDWYFDSSFI